MRSKSPTHVEFSWKSFTAMVHKSWNIAGGYVMKDMVHTQKNNMLLPTFQPIMCSSFMEKMIMDER